MTKKEFKSIVKKLDNEKYSLMREQIAFDIVTKDMQTGKTRHVGIGESQDMCELALVSLADLYKGTNGVTVENFAESIKTSFIAFMSVYSLDDAEINIINPNPYVDECE